MEHKERKRKNMESVNPEQITSDGLDRKVQSTDNRSRKQKTPKRRNKESKKTKNGSTEPEKTKCVEIDSSNMKPALDEESRRIQGAHMNSLEEIDKTLETVKNKRQSMEPLMKHFNVTRQLNFNCLASMATYIKQMRDLHRPVGTEMELNGNEVKRLIDQFHAFKTKYLALYKSLLQEIDKIQNLREVTTQSASSALTLLTREGLESLQYQLSEWFKSIPDPAVMDTEWGDMKMDRRMKYCHCVVKEWIKYELRK